MHSVCVFVCMLRLTCKSMLCVQLSTRWNFTYTFQSAHMCVYQHLIFWLLQWTPNVFNVNPRLYFTFAVSSVSFSWELFLKELRIKFPTFFSVNKKGFWCFTDRFRLFLILTTQTWILMTKIQVELNVSYGAHRKSLHIMHNKSGLESQPWNDTRIFCCCVEKFVA